MIKIFRYFGEVALVFSKYKCFQKYFIVSEVTLDFW